MQPNPVGAQLPKTTRQRDNHNKQQQDPRERAGEDHLMQRIAI